MGLVIRAATAGELLVIHALTQAAYAEYGHAPGTSSALKETPEAIAGQVDQGTRLLLLERNGTAVACVRYQHEGDALYFHRLAVDPGARRQGLATALIAHLEDEARAVGLARLTCAVRLAVEGNVALYNRLGFVQYGETVFCRDGTPVPSGLLEKRL